MILLVATSVAFLPAFDAEFVKWDDPGYVTDNPLLRDAAGLAEIWNPFTRKLPQYYPLVFSSYWVEYHLWQLDPRGYHATNVVLHLVNVLLALALMRALGAPAWVAVGATALFALHPVQVESVAWVTERKTTVSTLFYFAAFLLYLRHRRTRTWGAYRLSLVAFFAALLSKTQVLTLPLILLFTDWWLQQVGRLRRLELPQLLARVAPMLALAALASIVTTWRERGVTQVWAQIPTLTERLFIAVNAPWFYGGTFLAPFSLCALYPKWHISAASPQWWLGAVACVVALVLLVWWRHGLTTLPLWGVAHFFIALIPVLGFVPFAYQHYAFVADRFLYISCLGGGLVLATLADRVAGLQPWTTRRVLVTAAGVLALVGCAVATYVEATHWRTNFTFWTHVVARNPYSYPANINLGAHYASKGQWADAVTFYRKAHELQPTDTYALTNYLYAVGNARGPQAVIEACDAALAGNYPNAYAAYLFRASNNEALGRRQEALADYERVLALSPAGSSARQQAQRARDRLTQMGSR